jgi:ATP-dependent DNA helicase DinG
VQLVADACKGRTLALFTSYRALNATASMLHGHRVLKQGDIPRTQLVDTFREDVASVLLGTTSLWTGVDVSGESLTGLVIDKIPFDSPDDPVLSALQDKLGSKMFPLVSLPRAIIRLKQGVGRLIRAKTDHGVIVLLDQRVADKAYGRTILQALPRMRFARSLNAITDWLR